MQRKEFFFFIVVIQIVPVHGKFDIELWLEMNKSLLFFEKVMLLLLKVSD